MDTCISLIIPVHNAEPFLERCLDSAVAQTVPNLEIICINDASTDASRDILDAYASRDSRFRVVHREVNGGESVARNQGLSLARGEYLAFLDHDDMLEPDACRRLYMAASGTRADVAKGRVKFYEYDGQMRFSPLELHTEITQKSKFHFLIQWWSAIYRTGMIQGRISFAEGYPLGADSLFLTDALISAQKITCIDDVVYTYIRSPESGDSCLLTHAKIASVTEMNVRILTHLHDANIHTQDKGGYLSQAWNCFYRGINFIPRCIDRESRALCYEYIVSVMAMHKFPNELKSHIEIAYPVLSPLLNGDASSFKTLAIEEPDKFRRALGILAKLRLSVSRKLPR